MPLCLHESTTAPSSICGLIRDLPPWAPPLAGLAFIADNAAIEEALFRGVVLSHLLHTLGRWPALLAQAAGFGLLHLTARSSLVATPWHGYHTAASGQHSPPDTAYCSVCSDYAPAGCWPAG